MKKLTDTFQIDKTNLSPELDLSRGNNSSQSNLNSEPKAQNSTILIHLISVLIVLSSFCKTEAQNSADKLPGKLVVAACQFPVSANISENYNWIKSQIIEAKHKKADIVQFPECALSGYPGVDLKTLDDFNWDLLYERTDSVLSLAKQLKIWVLLGSVHRLSEGVKPHNSLYVINS
ncbi:MAG: carbon-nitrogen hydrolase family protein, partial [Prolixibacteraceae bacterium]|nr:carbon-nitrogen hydrolase family protein [Prolixibacteraceae bacterium]